MGNADVVRQYDLEYALIDSAAGGDIQLVPAPGAKKRIRVVSLSFVVAAAVSIRFKSAANNLSGLMTFGAAGQGVADRGSYEDPIYDCNPNEALIVNASAAVQVGGRVNYYIEYSA